MLPVVEVLWPLEKSKEWPGRCCSSKSYSVTLRDRNLDQMRAAVDIPSRSSSNNLIFKSEERWLSMNEIFASLPIRMVANFEVKRRSFSNFVNF